MVVIGAILVIERIIFIELVLFVNEVVVLSIGPSIRMVKNHFSFKHV